VHRKITGRAARACDAAGTADASCVSCAGSRATAEKIPATTPMLPCVRCQGEAVCSATAGRGSFSFPPLESLLMRRLALVIAVLASIAVAGSASAEQMRASARSQATAARKGPVAKLIEMERRKNEWLRQQFGR